MSYGKHKKAQGIFSVECLACICRQRAKMNSRSNKWK